MRAEIFSWKIGKKGHPFDFFFGPYSSVVLTEVAFLFDKIWVWQQRLRHETFGKNDTLAKTVDIVNLKVKCENDNSINMEVISTPMICSELLNQNIQSAISNFDHLKHLRLADSSEKINKEVQILVGVDYYYSFELAYKWTWVSECVNLSDNIWEYVPPG